MRVLDALEATTEHNPAADHDEEQRAKFDYADDVHASHAPLWKANVNCGDEGDGSDGNASLFPFSRFAIRSKDDVAREDGAAGRGEPEEDSLEGEEDSCQHSRVLVSSFEIDLLTATARYHATKFQPYEHAGEGEEETEGPQHERCTNASHGVRD